MAIFITLFLLIILLLVIILCIKRRKKEFSSKKNKDEAITIKNDIEKNIYKNVIEKKILNYRSAKIIIGTPDENKKNENDKSLNINVNLISASGIKHENSHMKTNFNSSNYESRTNSDCTDGKTKEEKKDKVHSINEKSIKKCYSSETESPKAFKNISASNISNIDENISNRILKNSESLDESRNNKIQKKGINTLGEQMILKKRIKFLSKEIKKSPNKSVNLIDIDNFPISRIGTENSYLYTNDNLILDNKVNIRFDNLNPDLKKKKEFKNNKDKENITIPMKLNIPRYVKLGRNPQN